MAHDSEATSTMTSSPSLFLPDSVPDEFKDSTFLDAIKSAKQTLGSVETGLSAKSEFELYFQTGASTLDFATLHKRAQNVDIRHSKIRSVYWKVFLSVIGNDTASWISALHTKRAQYTNLKDKYITDAMKEEDEDPLMDNPLLSTSGGKWDKFYKDTELRDTIVLDIDRTYPEDDFFVNKIVQHSLTDILFIYCKENQWISYKQGMNEIIATLFMVNTVQSTISPYVDDDSQIKTESASQSSADDDHPMPLWETVQDIRYIEHDTYFMFTEIMDIMGQYFINATGKDVPPVVERSKRIQGQFLRQMDTQLAQHLLKINLTPQLYGLRWIRLFFSREFHLRDVCVVWDAIFGAYSERKQTQQTNTIPEDNHDPMDPLKAIDHALERPHKIKLDFRFVDYMSCSMLLFIRHQLIGRDISHCLRRVMRYPPIEDIHSLIERAYTIRDHIERRGKKSNEYGKERRIKDIKMKKKWTSSELLTPFKLPVNTNRNHYNNNNPTHCIKANTKSHDDTFEGYSVDWISRHNQNYKRKPKPNHHKHSRSSLPNFSPMSVQRVPSAKYGKTKSELIDHNTDATTSYDVIADTTKNAVGVAAFAVAGFASTIWSSYATPIVSNSIDKTRSAGKHYNRIEQNVKKKISVAHKYVNVPPQLSKVPIKAKTTVSALSENVLKPLYQYNTRLQTDAPTDFVTYTPPKRFPFESPVKCVAEEKKMRLMSPDCKEQEHESEEEEDIFYDDDTELISNADTVTTATTISTATDITYNNINISSFSIDEYESKPSTRACAPPATIVTMPSVSRSLSSSTSSHSSSSSLSSVLHYPNDKSHYLNMFTSIQQTFEHYYYYNNVIMSPQQHLMSRLRELEQIRINFVLCITKSFEYNLIECNVSDFSKQIPQFDFCLFIEFNNDLYTSQSLNNARLYYLNYLHSFVIRVNDALTTYNEYYIHIHHHTHTLHRSKTAMSNNLNIADRWNQFSRTVSSAMTTYAEDVKSLMGGQRRTLKSRMQFEYALGTKMGQVLKHVQTTINSHREELNDAFLSQTLRTAMPPMTDTNEIKSNANARETADSKETEPNRDPLSDTLEDPLDAIPNHEAKPKGKQAKEENPLLVIEEALAELKLVKDALMGNLDETQLESWLDWTFVEPSPEPKTANNNNNESTKGNKMKSSPPLMALRRKKPSQPSNAKNGSLHRKRNLSSSGLVPPRKSVRKSPNLQPVSTLPQHPLD